VIKGNREQRKAMVVGGVDKGNPTDLAQKLGFSPVILPTPLMSKF
jgi:hypothetical protein